MLLVWFVLWLLFGEKDLKKYVSTTLVLGMMDSILVWLLILIFILERIA